MKKIMWIVAMIPVVVTSVVIDNPLEYARLYLDGEMQVWVDAEDRLDTW